MDMGTQGSGRRRPPTRERLTAEDDALSRVAREAEARLAAKRAARAEAREIRMKELERQQKEIYQVQKKYYGLDTKWGDIEQWMEDSERCSRRPRRAPSASDEDERVSVSSRGSPRVGTHGDQVCMAQFTTNGYDGELYGSESVNRRSGRVEEKPEKDFTEKGSRNMPSLSAATLASLGGTSSRRGSGDTSLSIDTEASFREIKELSELKDQIQDVEGKYMQGLKEMKDSLAEAEEKYRKAMVSNAQLDNEKTNFMYQVDSLKDALLELEEQLAESRRQYEEKNKEFEREKHAHSLLQFQFAEVKEALKQREEMLEEIRQLQQKQASYVREISDLQETVEWKDKKIGALERQKEFFDPIRNERDDLREEVAMLKMELKKHGIILNSEAATNGETSDPLNDVGRQDFTKMTKEEVGPLKSTGDAPLGRANEVEVKSGIVENVGKREILQDTEQEQHVEAGVDLEPSNPGEGVEGQSSSADTAPSPGLLADTTCEEQPQSHLPEHTASLQSAEPSESDKAIHVPGDRTSLSLEQSRCPSDLENEMPGPVAGQGSCNDLDTENESKESAETQERVKHEDFKTSLGEVSAKPCQESVPLQLSEAGRVNSAGTGEQRGIPGGSAVEAGLADVGEQVGTRVSSPAECGEGPVSRDESRGLERAPQELDLSPAHSSEEGPASQEVAEPKETPMQEKKSEEEDGESELTDDRPGQTEGRTVPSSPASQSDQQEAAGVRMLDPESEPLDVGAPSEGKSDQQEAAGVRMFDPESEPLDVGAPSEGKSDQQEAAGVRMFDPESEPLDVGAPSEGRSDQQGEVLDLSQRKTKNKKKKNKKKKSPVPAETLKDVKKELTFQDTDLNEVKEEDQVKFTDEQAAVEAQNVVAKKPDQEIAAEISDNVKCPEDPQMELDGKINREDHDGEPKAGHVLANRDGLDLEDGIPRSPSPYASDKELDETVIKGNARKDGAAHGCPPEPAHEGIHSSSQLGNESPPREINGAPQMESQEEPAMPTHPTHAVEEPLDPISLENADSSAPAGEEGDLGSGSRDARSGHEKGRSKEDCTMS
ncbi:leucine-rich repeat flightless-interacting protein 1 isoform X4 [Tamandua tetradactyla]|uniref:leucine-rich repeat flightless-interacting protein 1 isoform X4 n=1 Tax=Tamandua tetradactyla TaxID=48850 RepID=UPI0040540E35